MDNFPDRLKRVMRLRGKTQTDISNNCNIDKGNLSKYLSGKARPKRETIIKIAEYLNISPAYLLGISEDMVMIISKPVNSFPMNEETEMKRTLIREITALLTYEDIDNLKIILPVVKALCKANK